MSSKTRPATLRIALAGIVVATLGTLTGTSPVTPTPAEAQAPPDAAVAAAPIVTGLVTVDETSVLDSASPKTVVAQCPEGKQILGGGGIVDGAGDHDSTTMVTSMRPTDDDSVWAHGYAVSGAETPPGGDQRWRVRARAFCADPVPGHHIVTQSTAYSSPPTQQAVAVCPAGQRVLGTGATIDPLFVGVGYRNIGLQMVRAFGSGTSTRVQASELPGGYDHNWQLTAFAVCADTPRGYRLNVALSVDNHSEVFKHAVVGCPFGQWTNIGAAVDTPAPGWGAPGSITLSWLGVPLSGNWGLLEARAQENTPTSVNWVIQAQTICVL